MAVRQEKTSPIRRTRKMPPTLSIPSAAAPPSTFSWIKNILEQSDLKKLSLYFLEFSAIFVNTSSNLND